MVEIKSLNENDLMIIDFPRDVGFGKTVKTRVIARYLGFVHQGSRGYHYEVVSPVEGETISEKDFAKIVSKKYVNPYGEMDVEKYHMSYGELLKELRKKQAEED